MREDKKTKVQLSDEHGNVETLWADPLGGDLYRLDNTPWYACRVSCGDVVEARTKEPGGVPIFVRVVEKSGYRTIRLILKLPADKSPESQAVLDHLREMGCTYEGANPRFLAIGIPPVVDLEAVRTYLISTGQQWEHGDPTHEDLFPDQYEPARPAG
jgi:Domain of unknown function (DUF4265)